tara:strand:- start:421 stop:1110 length:690 start_codon:yes stop_codon:yes gene_type:complete
MAINFPNTPVNGSTYDYLKVRYTYTKPNAAYEGYWRVTTPGSVGIATSVEIDASADDAKYITPEGLGGSQYVRENGASGETTLNYNGSERLKTDSVGVEITGKLLLNGDTEKSGVKVGLSNLWTGSTTSGTINFSQPLSDFDVIMVEGYLTDSLASGLGIDTGVISNTYSSESILREGELILFQSAQSGSGGSYISLGLSNIVGSSATVNMSRSTYNGSIVSVYGIKYA